MLNGCISARTLLLGSTKARVILVIMALGGVVGCSRSDSPRPSSARPLNGASSYTPFDSFSMLWTRADQSRKIVWVSSGAEAGNLLVSDAPAGKRPEWIFCTQGVVAALSAQGKDVRIIASVYVSDDAILPVLRNSMAGIEDSRSIFIPRSSNELAFDRYLQREGTPRDRVRVPQMEKVSFSTLKSLLTKPMADPGSIDFALLVDPFITNIMKEQPGMYRIGRGGLYEMHYSLVVRRQDLEARRSDFIELLREMLVVDRQLSEIKNNEEFYNQVWGRMQNGQPDRLSQLLAFHRDLLGLRLKVVDLRKRLREELEYLTGKYPDQLKMPQSSDALVDPSLLKEVDPKRVVE